MMNEIYSVVVQEEEYLRRRRGDVWCYPPKPTEPKLNGEDDVYMTGSYNRDVSKRKAKRKRRIAREIYYCWSKWSEQNGWEYYDNLHQYSKNKIHCSCPDCNTKTRNKGSRRQKSGNYKRAIHYKASDLRRAIDMDEDLREHGYYASKHRRTRFE